MSNVRQGGETKEKTSTKPDVKMKKHEVNKLLLKQRGEKHMRQNGQLRSDSIVSVCEKGIVFQSHKREESFIHQAVRILKRSLCRYTQR